MAGRRVLRGALELDDGQVLTPAVVVDVELEADAGLTADESLRDRTSRSSRPSRPGLESRNSTRPASAAVDLIRSCTTEPGMRPMAVIPGEVEPQFVPECGEPEGDQDQAPSALHLDGSDAPLNHREAAILPDGAESVLNTPPMAPPPESLRGELNALVGDEMPGSLTRLPEDSLQESPNRA